MSNPTAGPERIAIQDWQRFRWGSDAAVVAALAYWRERGWPVDEQDTQEAVNLRIGAFVSGYRSALAAAQGAGTASREQILAAVDAEEELNGPLPAHMRTAFLESPENSMRATVRATKAGIRARLEALFAEASHE